MAHPTPPPPRRQRPSSKKPTESHAFQFRGVWLPARVVRLVSAGTVTGVQQTLLVMVEALTPEDGSAGCYASNRYLADAMGVHPLSVPRMIAHLKDLGLLRSEVRGGVRHLWTTWGDDSVGHGGVNPQVKGGLTHRLTRRSQEKRNEAKTPPAGGRGASSEVDAMSETALIPLPAKDNDPSPFDEECVRRLREAMKKKGCLMRPYNARQWANQFRLLRQQLRPSDPAAAKADVKKILRWYMRHLREPFVPLALSAEAFRKKWDAILDAARRDAARNPVIDVGDAAWGIAGIMRNLGADGSERMAAVAQTSLDRLKEFRRRVRQDCPPAVRGFADELLRVHLADPVWFAGHWMEKAWGRLHNWPDWSGDLMTLAFDPSAKQFRQMGRAWAVQYDGRPDAWEELMGALQCG